MDRPIWQRIGAILCCLVFICCFGLRITADAVFTEFAVGGAIAVGVASLIAATLVAFGASDLAEPIQEAADQANTDVKSWLTGRFEAYVAAQNTVPGAIQNTPLGIATALLRSLSYNSDGSLIFGKELSDFVYDFGQWLIGNGDISISGSGSETVDSVYDSTVSNAIIFPISIGTISANTVTRIADANSDHWRFKASVDTKVVNLKVSSGDAWHVLCCASSAFSFGRHWSVDNFAMDSTSASYTHDGKTVYWTVTSGSASNLSFPTGIPVTSVSSFNVSNLDQVIAWCSVYGTSSTGASSGLDVWNDDTATDGFVLDPTGILDGALQGVADGAIAQIGDYLDALAGAIAGAVSVSLPIAGIGAIDIPAIDPIAIDIPIDIALPADIAVSIPATGEADEPYTGTGDYTLPLADFFPFCIPFDIYAMLSLLSSSPVAPQVNYPFPLPGGGTYTINIDLSQFDTVASVLRTMETLAFCVGLGFVTKKLLFGS